MMVIRLKFYLVLLLELMQINNNVTENNEEFWPPFLFIIV